MNRDTQNILLILLGGAVLRISLGTTYLRYVKESLQPFLIAAGGLLIVLGLVSLVADHRVRRSRDDHAHAPQVAWLLLLPVMAIFLVAPPALGSYAAERDDGQITRPKMTPSFPALPRPEAGAAGVPLSLTNYYSRAVWDEGETLGDRVVQLTGFVTARPAGGFHVTRLRISCCAADAQSIRVVVLTDEPPPAVDTWVRVTGVYAPALVHPSEGYEEPTITARIIDVVPEPEPAYEVG